MQAVVSADDSDLAVAGLTPDDPNVIVGRNLHMTCQLYSSRYRARDLRFQFRLFNADDHIEASASDIHVVNASVAELNYTNMRPHFDRAIIVCYHNNNPDLEAVQIIKVGCEWFLPFVNFVKCSLFSVVDVFLLPDNICVEFVISKFSQSMDTYILFLC